MRKLILILAAALVAAPAFADKKLDDAVAKAESLAEKGKPEEASRPSRRWPSSRTPPRPTWPWPGSSSGSASPDEAQASLTKAVELSKAATPDVKAEALAALSGHGPHLRAPAATR